MYAIAVVDMVALLALTACAFVLARHVRNYGLQVSPRGSYDGAGDSGSSRVSGDSDISPNSASSCSGDSPRSRSGNSDGGVSKRYCGDGGSGRRD